MFVRDARFADALRAELRAMIEEGARPVDARRWLGRSLASQAVCWIAYGIVRAGMGLLGYGGNEWWGGRPRKR